MRTAPLLLALSALPLPFALAPRLAHASECGPVNAIQTCIDADTLWPHAGAGRFVSIGGTETVAPHHVAFGLVTSYQSRPIVLNVPSPGPAGSSANVIDDQVNGTFLWGFGITRRLELDFVLPVTFGQGGTGVNPLAANASKLQDTAMRDIRFGFAYALLPPEAHPAEGAITKAIAVRMEVSAPTGDQDQFAGERGAVFLPSIAGEAHKGRWFAGLEVGMRVRPTAQLLDSHVGTQIAVALGAGFDVLDAERLSAILEARALPTISGDNTKALVPSEWMLSLRSVPIARSDFAVQLGGGGAIPIAGDAPITTPRFRFALSLRYTPLDRDSDGDGILDADDRCPTRAAPVQIAREHVRSDVLQGPRPTGCPSDVLPEGTPALSLDLSPARDVCKEEPDTADGFRDDDGCPDEDADKDGIDNRYDRCPLVSEDYAGLQDGCAEKPGAP